MVISGVFASLQSVAGSPKGMFVIRLSLGIFERCLHQRSAVLDDGAVSTSGKSRYSNGMSMTDGW